MSNTVLQFQKKVRISDKYGVHCQWQLQSAAMVFFLIQLAVQLGRFHRLAFVKFILEICRYGPGSGGNNSLRAETKKLDNDEIQDGVNVLADAGGVSYGDYLQLDKILTAQEPQSRIHGKNSF